MQPLKIIVPGHYWDSQIYRGKLYLFDRNGDIVTVNWDALINALGVEPENRLALTCAFTSSDLLYDPRVEQILGDVELRPTVRSKFERLARGPIELLPEQLESYVIKKQRNPFPFPHADSTIYYNAMYVGGPSGVWSATCAKPSGNPVSSRPRRAWDASVFAVAASYGALACAAGDEGLFEMSLQEYRDPQPVTTRNCVDCQWTFQSIYGSSHIAHGFLAEYEKVALDPHRFTRAFERIVDDSEIFQDVGYSWGTQDKICQAIDGRVHIVNYVPASEKKPARLDQLQTINLDPWKGEVVSGKLAVFGAIIECDAAIVVALSDESVVTLRGEPINWRVFPKSVRYENHLHVVYDDHVLVASFNQDYFVDKKQKRVGIKYYPVGFRWSGSYERADSTKIPVPPADHESNIGVNLDDVVDLF
jgi:hypothetical protein